MRRRDRYAEMRWNSPRETAQVSRADVALQRYEGCFSLEVRCSRGNCPQARDSEGQNGGIEGYSDRKCALPPPSGKAQPHKFRLDRNTRWRPTATIRSVPTITRSDMAVPITPVSTPAPDRALVAAS